MTIRKTEEKDTAAVLTVYEDARQYFFHNGIPQWQNGTPNLETLQEDMRRGYSYVLEENGRIIGAWLNDEPYVVVHRIAVPSSCKGNGYASKLLAFAGEKAEENGWRNLRIDTHEKNWSMRRLLEKNGFSMCGNVIVGRWKEPRIAYQKVL